MEKEFIQYFTRRFYDPIDRKILITKLNFMNICIYSIVLSLIIYGLITRK